MGEIATNSMKPANKSRTYKGEVVYIYAYDVAYDMKREPVRNLLGRPVVPFGPGATSKPSPREMFFYRPEMAELPSQVRQGPYGTVEVRRFVKIFPVGAISVTIRVPFEVRSLDELVPYHDLRFADGTLNDEVRRLAKDIVNDLRPHCIRPVEEVKDEEAYTVFCVYSPLSEAAGERITAEGWLMEHRRPVAALLTQEPGTETLSTQEAQESTQLYLSYYDNDLVVVDWDAAIVIDRPENCEEVLHVMELANVQLAELEAYDRTVDTALERSYRDLRTRWRRRSETLGWLRELHIDLARLSDELSNITKFFGDWHLARVYQQLCARFHLDDWQRILDQKLKALADLYQILKHERDNNLMMILEIMIVVLFVIDLVILFVGLGK
jgi:hypothetical protein